MRYQIPLETFWDGIILTGMMDEILANCTIFGDSLMTPGLLIIVRAF